MTPNFKEQAVHILDGWKSEGLDAIHAIRALETLCGKNGEEFHPDGQRLVEDVYIGRFSPAIGGTGLKFTPKPREEGSSIVFAPAVSEPVEVVAEGDIFVAPEGVTPIETPDRTPRATVEEIKDAQTARQKRAAKKR